MYNVGNGSNYSVNEIAGFISNAVTNIPPRVGEVMVSLADNSKLKNTFGWKPSMTVEKWISEQL